MSDRGLTPLVGFILLVGITAVGAMSLFVVGMSLADATQSSAQQEQVEQSMAQFAETADELAVGESNEGSFTIDGQQGDDVTLDEDAGNIRIELEHNGTQEIMDENIGALVYEGDDGTKTAYQGGGVWRKDSGTSMVKAPEFQYRADEASGATLTFPLIRLQGQTGGDGSIDGSLSVEDEQDLYPTANDSNPLEGGSVFVEIQSEYCEAWEKHLEDRTDASVRERCSRAGDYTDVGELRFALIVPDDGVGDIQHAAVAPGGVTPGGGGGTAEIDGDIVINDSDDVGDNVHINGDVQENSPTITSPQSDIDERVADCAGNWSSAPSTVTSPGTHCFTEIDSGMSIDSSGGQVTIVVRDSIDTRKTVSVNDGDKVQFYVNGSFTLNGNGDFGNPDDSSQTHLFASNDVTVESSQTELYGLIYAPDSHTKISGNAEVHGAVVSDWVKITGSQSRIFYDSDLSSMNVEISNPAEGPSIYYLHASETVMSVEEN